MSAPRLVLASASAARAELLAAAGFSFEVRIAPADAELAALEAARRRGGSPEELVLAAARAKAEAVAAALAQGPAVVLAADTVAVTARGEILGKGRDQREAAAILAKLAGTRHRVLTGVVALAVPGGRRRELVAGTELAMSPMSAAQIAVYVASGAACGAAGAYRIQEGGADRLVRVVSGSLSNVVGLPVEEIIPVLAGFAILPVARRPDGADKPRG
jgi:septum formation protein